MLERFQDYIEQNALLTKEDKVLVAVSGGLDSMALLSMLIKSGYFCGIAHCNFQLRGEESDLDEKLVGEVALHYQLPFHTNRFDTEAEIERSGESMQIVARRLRYNWFHSLLKYEGYTKIAIAHHADDSIETFFINLIRGTGLRGLTGIDLMRGDIVRPLMFATRGELEEYVKESEVPYRDDATNQSTKYLRNKIRLELIPKLMEMNEGFEHTMEGNLGRLNETLRFVDVSIESIRKDCERHSRGIVTINPQRIDSNLPLNFVLYELLDKYGFGGNVVDSLTVALKNSQTGKRFYAKEKVAYINRGKIVIAPIEKSKTSAIRIGKNEKEIEHRYNLKFEYISAEKIENLIVPENIALLDADKLKFPLTLRRWQDGDWFIPIGMEGRKKVSDFLIDEKVSMVEKQRQDVLLSDGMIVWVVGRRIDDRYKLTEGTKKVYKIEKG